MPLLVVLLVVIGFWLGVHYLEPRIQHRLQRSSTSATSPSSTSWQLGTASLHIDTTLLNHVPPLLLKPFRRGKQYTRHDRVLAIYWDLGAVMVVVALLFAQLVLIYAAFRGVYAVIQLGLSVKLSSGVQDAASGALQRLKRALVQRQIADLPSESLLIRPIVRLLRADTYQGQQAHFFAPLQIPGVTHSLDSIPLLIFALFTSQVFHELGHALAAASEFIATLSTGFRLHLVIPTFYVALPAHSASPSTDLRIAAAGVWHNILLVAFAYLISSNGLSAGTLITRIFYERVDGGLFVVGVDSTSPLYQLLPTRSILTHLDDLELDSSSSPLDLWAAYLSTSPSSSSTYESLGWCLPRASFDKPGTPLPSCCEAGYSQSTELCFQQMWSPSSPDFSFGCLDPSPLFYPSKEVPTRCLNNQGCRDGKRCATLTEGEKITRIGIAAEPGEQEGKTIVYQGSRQGVLHQVSVSNFRPRSRLIPLTYLRAIERFYSHLLALSLALAFFNLLPLPYLDGEHLLHSLCVSIIASPSLALEEGLGIEHDPSSKEGGLLETFLHRLRNVKVIRDLAEEGEEVGRVMRKWTVVLGAVTGVTSVAVVLTSSARGLT